MTSPREKAENLFAGLTLCAGSPGDAVELIERALQEAREEVLEEAIEYFRNYRKAYDESIAPPVDMETFAPDLRTSVGMRMGRFILDNCIKDFQALKQKGGEPAGVV